MKILSVGNQKGGVGKTTLAIHLAHYAAERGAQVLLIDMDEGDVAEAFPVDDAGADSFLKASELFTGIGEDRLPRFVSENIALIEADVALLDVDDMPLDVVARPAQELARFVDEFDLCIIDTPPNLQRRMIGALAASDALVAPFNIDTFALARIPKLLRTVENVRANLNPRLQHLGYLANRVNSKSVNEIEALPELREAYGAAIFDEAVIERACIKTSLAQGLAVWQRARSGNQRQSARELRSACAAIFARLGLDLND